MTSGASSLPGPEERHDRAELPSMDELRGGLRPPALPLPSPRDVAEAALRAGDLLGAGRTREARRLIEVFRTRPAASADRLALLHVALLGALRTAEPEQVERDLLDLVTLLRRDGHRDLASALVTVLLEGGALPDRSVAATGASGASGASGTGSRRGRRRGSPSEVPLGLLAVVRALLGPALTAAGELHRRGIEPSRGGAESERSRGGAGPRRRDVDPHRLVTDLRAARAALPAVRDRLPWDPEQTLRLQLAQSLERLGDRPAAATEALDLLEMIDHERTEPPRLPPLPGRTTAGAHAVLARTLGVDRPLHGARHALDALGALQEVDDPTLRVTLISHLLRALMAAGATTQASFTAGRLASLQRTLPRDALRTAPLLAIAAQRVQAERYEAAWVSLDQARRIARDQRDHRSSLEAARLAASIHDRTGDHDRALRELRRVASEARWLADDLATPPSERADLVGTELKAHALIMRRALDLGRTALVEEAGERIARRTRPEGGRPLLPAPLLWDHAVDAQVARFIASGEALRRGEEGATLAVHEQRRQAAMQAIDTVPAGHEDRARYWAAYVDDRHAQMLADRGLLDPALRAARRARAGWAHLDHSEDLTRVDALIAQLDQG